MKHGLDNTLTADPSTAERLDKELRQKSQASHEWLWQMLQDAVPRLLQPVEGPEAIVFLDNPLEGKEMQVLTRLANGFVIYLPPLALLVDPGPDIITRALASGVELQRLNSIFISHPHMDHYAGAEAAIEEMCFLMLLRRGHLLLSEDTARSTVISAFHRGEAPHGGPEQVIVLHPGEPVELLGARLTPVPAYHNGGGCGLIIEKNGLRLGYTSDTSYIVSYQASDGTVRTIEDNFAVMEDLAAIEDYRHDLKAAYSDVDVLVANVGGHASGARMELSALALAHLLRGSQVQLCLATHFMRTSLYPTDLRADIARYVQAASGVPTIVAESRLRLELATFRRRGKPSLRVPNSLP